MIDTQYLKRLIKILKESQVSSFKDGGLELVFHVEQPEQTSSAEAIEELKENLKRQEESLPPDLRTDAITNFDSVLFHSAGGVLDELPIPGITEEAL